MSNLEKLDQQPDVEAMLGKLEKSDSHLSVALEGVTQISENLSPEDTEKYRQSYEGVLSKYIENFDSLKQQIS